MMNLKEFNNLLFDIVKEIQPLIHEYVKNNRIFETFYDYPEVTYEKDFPSFSTRFYTNCPYKYSSLILGKQSESIDIYALKSVKTFVVAVKKESCFINKFLGDSIKSTFEKAWGELLLFKLVLADIIDRILLTYNFLLPTEDEFLKISTPIYNYIFADFYTYDVYVPILFTKFDFQNKNFENYSITKMDNDIQLARCNALKYIPGVNYALEACATHAFVIHDIQKKNIICSVFERKMEDEYAPEYTATLPYIRTFRVEEYPNYFKDYYWNSKSFPTIKEQFSESILKMAKEISALDLKNGFNRKLDISINRLRSSYLKISDEDAFLDLVIGIETLLSDDDKGELTYKLSVRVAVVLSKFADFMPLNRYEIYTAMKKIYAYRSAIVHGKADKDVEKAKKIILEDANYETKDSAEFFLQNLIKIAFGHKDVFTTSGKIEELLLLDIS